MRKVTKKQIKEIILEHSNRIEGRRMTCNEVNELIWCLDGLSHEHARIRAFCELEGWIEPDFNEFATLEEFKTTLEKELAEW